MCKIARLLVACLASSAAMAQPVPDTVHDIVSSGVARSYLLHVPEDYDGAAVPLVLDFHGSGGAPLQQSATSRFGSIADREGFAVAFPAGVFSNSITFRSWNANVEAGVDDVQFARDVIEDVAARLNIDASRIYAAGFSGGARMTSRLACELSDLLAAAAPVAGLQYPDDCTPTRPISILAIHGKADRNNPYVLSSRAPSYWRMGVETAVEKWRDANRCGARYDVTEVGRGIEQRTWADCGGGADVVLYVIADGGHVWPAFASEVIWTFFARHRLQ